MSGQKERLLEEAISHQIGNNDWAISDITGRGEFIIHPDKTETFCFDGVELIYFGHTRTEIDDKGPGIKINAVQDYKLLYT